MLGCQDFCGYYDWTFHYVAERYGDDVVQSLWADAIGGDAQSHYLAGALRAGLRGLFQTWVKTGEDEHCDWTFTLDEARNVLRWDMRQCPSKGFLLNNDLNAHVDYCDHCMGWIAPLLARAGIEVLVHEHNHCGQCWAEMTVRGRPVRSLNVARDIRADARWQHGYLDRWEHSQKVTPPSSRGQPDVIDEVVRALPCPDPHIIGGESYPEASGRIDAVLIDFPPIRLPAIAERYLRTPKHERPVLLYTYPPSGLPVDFLALDLPRPLPVLPLLIARGVYRHRPASSPMNTQTLIQMILLAIRGLTQRQ